MNEKKELIVSASVDIGNNIKELVEKLASQIGTTTDKIFPWFVKQSIIDGYTTICLIFSAIIIGLICAISTWEKVDYGEGNGAIPINVIGFILVLGGIAGLFVGFSTAISQIFNPEYHAMQEYTKSMATLLNSIKH